MDKTDRFPICEAPRESTPVIHKPVRSAIENIGTWKRIKGEDAIAVLLALATPNY